MGGFFFFFYVLVLMDYGDYRQTGGREANKTQRRVGFSIHDRLEHLIP